MRTVFFKGTVLFTFICVFCMSAIGQEDYTQWAHSRDLVINTSSAGYNISSSLANFPYLVLLTKSNFDFSQAKAGGDDIRFAASSGTHLSYQINDWDKTGQKASVWVLVGQIQGNNATQAIKIYWGNASASSASNGSAVFNAPNGFVAAYHLEETSGNAMDATPNALNGTPKNKNNGPLPSDTAGIIGKAKYFDNPSVSYYDMGTDAKLNFAASNIFSVSAWVNHAGVGGNGWGWEAFMSRFKWDGQDARSWMICWKDGAYQFHVCSDGTTGGETVARGESITDRVWYHVAATMDGQNMKIYVNGVQQASQAKTSLFNASAVPFFLGAGDDGQGFNGAVDEAWVSSVARSADWIKMSYLNQKGFDLPLALRFPKREYTLPINAIVDPIVPVFEGIADSFTVTPALPNYLQLSTADGTINGWCESPSAKQTYYIRMVSGSKFAEDTIAITVIDDQSGIGAAAGTSKSVLPRILGLVRDNSSGDLRLAFSLNSTVQVKQIRVDLFSLRGARFCSYNLNAGQIEPGTQTVRLPAANSGIPAGVYFAKMTVISSGSNPFQSVTSQINLLR